MHLSIAKQHMAGEDGTRVLFLTMSIVTVVFGALILDEGGWYVQIPVLLVSLTLALFAFFWSVVESSSA